jgi:hypothetical protein
VKWVEWRPKFAPHVKGEYTDREIDPETHMPLEQKYKIVCENCGATWGPLGCSSGMVRQHISRFALGHIHRDPLLDPFPKRSE